MESVAAERLNKIGINREIVSKRENFEEDINTVNEIIMQTTPLASSGSEMSLTSSDSRHSTRKKKTKKHKHKREKDSSPSGEKHYTGVKEGIKSVLALKKSRSASCMLEHSTVKKDDQHQDSQL